MSVTIYSVQGVGNDLNSGSTTGSVPKVSGTGAATASGVTVDLSVDSPNLSTVVSGDTIRLNGRSDGKNSANRSDIFEITAVDDGADTVDVTPNVDSVTSGVTWAIGGAFATLDRLVTTASKGDLLYAKGTYNETLDMVNATENALVNQGTRLVGYETTPGDSGLVTLDSNYTKSNACVLGWNAYWSFENIRLTRYTGQGFRDVFASTPLMFIHCEVDHINGTVAFGTSKDTLVIDCYAHDNASDGFSGKESCYILNCVSVNNGEHGFSSNGGNTYFGCISVANAEYGFYQSADLNHKGYELFHCLVDGSGITKRGFSFVDDANSRQAIIQNNIVFDCASGIVCNVPVGKFALGEHNLVADCPVPHVNFIERQGFVSGTPTFLDRANLDYRPASGAPQIGVGNDMNYSSWLPLP